MIKEAEAKAKTKTKVAGERRAKKEVERLYVTGKITKKPESAKIEAYLCTAVQPVEHECLCLLRQHLA